jgi:3-oxoacyl-[acyl-carrier-protein] synthase-3
MVGISAIHVQLPSGRRVFGADADLGVRSTPVLAPGESVWELAADAAGALLDRAGVRPESVGLLVFASVGVWGRDFWSPAAHLLRRLGAKRAFAFDVLNGCNSGNLALHLAAEWLGRHRACDNALVVVGDALSGVVDYANPVHRCVFNFSDAATALLVRRGEERNRPLSFVASTNPAFADSTFREHGQPTVWMNDDAEEDRLLIQEYRTRYAAMIHAALAEAGLSIGEVDHLFMNQGDFKLIDHLARQLPLDPGKIFRSHWTHGHLGGSDIFFGLNERLQGGLVQPGQVLILASSAIGFSWGASVIRA